VRTIPLIDVETLARACRDGDLATFNAESRIGWTLDTETARALVRALPALAFGLADAITLITEAAMNDSGIAYAEVTPLPIASTTFVIAFRHGEHIHFGVGYGRSVGKAWPILAPWYRDLERNRAKLELWRHNEDLVSLRRHRPPADAHEGGEALLAAVLADPSNVEARLVYADWLLARGDVRGEIIALAERVRDEPVPEIEQKLDRLLSLNGRQLAGEVANEATDWTLERGFVVRVQMRAAAFARAGAELLAQHPIEQLDVRPFDSAALKRLTEVEALRAIRVLRLASSDYTKVDFTPLWACPFLDSLRELDIQKVRDAEDSGAGIARMVAPAFESLRLVDVGNSLRMLLGLLENPSIRLRRLALTDVAVDWPVALLASPALCELHTLALDRMRAPVVAGLLEHAELPRLEALSLGQLPGSDLPFANLRRLSLGYVELDIERLRRLLARHPRLEAFAVGSVVDWQAEDIAELLLALPGDHPLAAVELGGAAPEVGEHLRTRFR
jgi:uncharacterized protein (TIGR02996 family)